MKTTSPNLPVPRVFLLTFALAASLATSTNAEQVRYRVEVDNQWTSQSHPDAFHKIAHFSWIGGATHNSTLSLWRVDELASPAVVQMAELGETTLLLEEVATAIQLGTAYAPVDQKHWFCPDEINVAQCGPMEFDFWAHTDFPEVTLVTMLGPSPDWFVGVSGLGLRDADGWIDQIQVELFPYDGGTRSNNSMTMQGPLTLPPDPITHITIESGQIIKEQSLGTFTITRIGDCDLNLDLQCDAADVDLIAAPFDDLDLDLNEDDVVDLDDRRYWAEALMDSRFGDADLDGDVDFLDFVRLAENFQQPGGWAEGDFDGSGTTDFLDFISLAENFGATTTSSAVSVPEPTSFQGLLGLLLLVAIRYANRRKTSLVICLAENP